MKLSFCFLTAVAAIDRPTISLDLDESKLVHRTKCTTENGCKMAKNFHTRHSVNVANKQLSSYVHSCVAKKDTAATCPLPQAKAYDHHDGLLAKVDYKLYLVNNNGKPAVQHSYKCSGSSVSPKNCINYNLRSEWIARYDAADASGNSAEQVVFAIILNDPIAPKWTSTKWKLHEGKHCGGAVGGLYGTSIRTWADGTSANYGQKKMANLKQCQAECARHADCSGFVQRDSDNNCNFWKGGKLAPFALNGHHCYEKQTAGSGPVGQTLEAGPPGKVFTTPTFYADDNYDGRLVATKTAKTVNLNKCISHKVTYTATDKAGMFGARGTSNYITKRVSFPVQDTKAPVCKVTPVKKTYQCGVDNFKLAKQSVVDYVDGIVKGTTKGTVNTLKTGSYPVTYCIAKDSGCGGGTPNVTPTQRFTYKVVDTLKPTITIGKKHLDKSGILQYYAGQKNQDVKVTFMKSHTQGYTCSDICDKNAKPTATWSPKPFACKKPSDTGTYTLKYGCSDYTGNANTNAVTVICEDHDVPVLNLIGAKTMSIESTHTNPTVWPDPGATCQDAFEGQINSRIQVTNTVNRAKVGTYIVKYNCCDSKNAGKTNCAQQQTRKVVVFDDHCPTCTISGAKSITREASFPYTDLGAKCSDTHDGALPYITVGKFDVEKVDTYKLTYRSKDKSGNWNDGNNGKNRCHCDATRDAARPGRGNCIKHYVRTIVVKDTLKPVISLSYANKEIHRSKATDTGVNHGKENQLNPAAKHVFMAETQTSVNGWIMGAVASATAGVALLGLSTRKATVTSVPV